MYLEFLNDEVEIVPAVVREEAGVEGQRNLGDVLLSVVPREVLSLNDRYKCIGIELDLFPQLTMKNSLYVYSCKQ